MSAPWIEPGWVWEHNSTTCGSVEPTVGIPAAPAGRERDGFVVRLRCAVHFRCTCLDKFLYIGALALLVLLTCGRIVTGRLLTDPGLACVPGGSYT